MGVRVCYLRNTLRSGVKVSLCRIEVCMYVRLEPHQGCVYRQGGAGHPNF